MPCRAGWRGIAVVAAGLSLLVSGCGKDWSSALPATKSVRAGPTSPAPSGSAPASPSPSDGDADGAAEAGQRRVFGRVSLVVPDGWGWVVDSHYGPTEVQQVELDEAQLAGIEETLRDGALVVLVDASTVTGFGGAMTDLSLYLIEDVPDELSVIDLTDFLDRGVTDAAVGRARPFEHPSVAAAAVTFTVTYDAVEFLARNYALGTSPVVYAEYGTDPALAEARLARADDIVRSIRVR